MSAYQGIHYEAGCEQVRCLTRRRRLRKRVAGLNNISKSSSDRAHEEFLCATHAARWTKGDQMAPQSTFRKTYLESKDVEREERMIWQEYSRPEYIPQLYHGAQTYALLRRDLLQRLRFRDIYRPPALRLLLHICRLQIRACPVHQPP